MHLGKVQIDFLVEMEENHRKSLSEICVHHGVHCDFPQIVSPPAVSMAQQTAGVPLECRSCGEVWFLRSKGHQVTVPPGGGDAIRQQR